MSRIRLWGQLAAALRSSNSVSSRCSNVVAPSRRPPGGAESYRWCSSVIQGPQAAPAAMANSIPKMKYSTVTAQQKKPDWNRAVSDAEKIVGYPTSYLTLRSLFSDEMSNIALHMRKLVGSSHPLLKTAKRLIYNGRNNMQTRGLIVLLISKAAGHLDPNELEQDKPAGVSHNQRSLAEITEMIHTAHLIHKGVVNLSPAVFSDGTTLQDMEFGNKIAILSGDYLLANACTGLASLRNTHVVELVSTAISDFMEAEFIGEFDTQGNPMPTADFDINFWEEKNFKAAGSLMAKSCKAAVLLAGHGEELQERSFEFGCKIALAWQAQNDLQPFTDLYRNPPGTAFDMTSAPVVLHLKNNPEFINIIHDCDNNLDNLDYKYLHSMILSGGAVEETKELCHSYVEAALEVLNTFEPTDARTALENIVHALKN